MTEEKKVAAFGFKLPSGKKIVLRQPKIKDSRVAAKVAGASAKDNQVLLQVLIQEEMAKILLLEIDGKKVSLAEKEDLDSLFTVNEYGYVLQAIQKLTGGDEEGELLQEETTIGLS